MIRDLVVELVSPAMVGGADNQCDKPPTLRPPSVRGQLRFWARATGGPDLERRLWGDVESGQRVRILGAQPLDEPRRAFLLPHHDGRRRTVSDMVPPGQRVLLRFAIPRQELVEGLQANLWIWLHLGAIGRRSRRGYGALLWEPHDGHLLDGFLGKSFDRWRDLDEPGTLRSYLERGLDRSFTALRVTPEATRPSRQPGGDFQLRSLDQVFVGSRQRGYRWHVERGGGPGPEHRDLGSSFEALLHGLNPRDRGSASNQLQLGRGSSKPPSPMIWRLFPSPSGSSIPVMTWSPLGYPQSVEPQLDAEEAGKLRRYLTDELGFEQSLTGGYLWSSGPESEDRRR